MEETGTVVAAREDTLWVEIQARSSCSLCSSSSCTTSLVAQLFNMKRNQVALENTLGATVGEQVVIGIPDELLVRASVLAYLLPLVVMITAALLGGTLGAGDGIQSLLALAGLAIGLFLVHRATQSKALQQRFKPQLLNVAGQAHVQVDISQRTRSRR